MTPGQADGDDLRWDEQNPGRCGSSYYEGRRFIAYDFLEDQQDYAVMPLYDVNGVIAGIQVGMPAPVANNRRTALVWDATVGMYVMTAYFVDPSIICTTGRSAADLARQGAGDRLVLQNGPGDLINIPLTATDADRSPWTRGKCFDLAMGLHYWYEITSSMDCRDFLPMFLLYGRDGRLDGFGWAFLGQSTSARFENPPAFAIPAFLPDNYPSCLDDRTFSTQHIYLVDDVYTNLSC